MKCGHAIRASVAAVAALLALGTSAAGVEERPLPMFAVQDALGQTVASTQLTTAGQYVLLYVAPNCRPCDRILELTRNRDQPIEAGRLVVLVAADPATASSYVTRQIPAGGEVPWFADGRREAFRAFPLTGWPVLMGVRQGRVMWSVSGVLNDGSAVASILRSWVTY